MNHHASEQLIAEIRALAPWHHDIEVLPGVSTWEVAAGAPYDEALGNPLRVPVKEHFSPLLRRLFPDGLGGRSFLDVACNGGGYTFAARDLGAGRCFGFDARQLWVDQARLVARYRRDSEMNFEKLTLADLASVRPEPFNVSFFGGILYHLTDPANGLRIAADLTQELLIVNTASFPGDGQSLKLEWEDDKRALAGLDTLCWLPTGPQVVQDLLKWCGFPHSRVDYDIALPNGRHRLQIVAAREASTLVSYDAASAESAPAWAKDKGLARRLAERWTKVSRSR